MKEGPPRIELLAVRGIKTENPVVECLVLAAVDADMPLRPDEVVALQRLAPNRRVLLIERLAPSARRIGEDGLRTDLVL